MKKLTFMNIKGQELTREELRNVMAGCGGSGGGGGTCQIYENCPPGSQYPMVSCIGNNGNCVYLLNGVKCDNVPLRC